MQATLWHRSLVSHGGGTCRRCTREPPAPATLQPPLQIICRTAAQLAAPLLRPALAGSVPEAAALSAHLAAAAAGGGREGLVDADEACELLLVALEAQRAADMAQLEVRSRQPVHIGPRARLCCGARHLVHWRWWGVVAWHGGRSY